MDNIVGKFAHKNRGFFEGIVGVVRLNESELGLSKYLLEYSDGSFNAFHSKREVTVLDTPIEVVQELTNKYKLHI